MKLACMLTVAACATPPADLPKASPVPSPAPLTSPASPPPSRPSAALGSPTCVKSLANPVYESSLVGDTLRLCFLDQAVVDCWHYQLAADTWAPVDRHPDVPKQAPPPVTVAGSTITACKPDGSDCRSIPFSPALTTDETGEAWMNVDRSLVALLVGEGPIRVLDLAGTSRSTIKAWPTAMSDGRAPAFFRQARFVGPSLAVFIADTPITSAIRLFDPRTGKRIGDVGDGKPMSDGVEPIDLGANRFGFVEFDTSAIVIHDVTTGRLVKKYAIPGVEPAGFSLVVMAPDGKSLLAAQGAVIYRVELVTGKVGRFPAPSCPG